MYATYNRLLGEYAVQFLGRQTDLDRAGRTDAKLQLQCSNPFEPGLGLDNGAAPEKGDLGLYIAVLEWIDA